ncbi:unnamed protein product [Phytophthora fragariaefolia]|uniref:Unnamed protein product n=1 Tax=Phytophthora fragariaefolia TaxID=1490495 RepID=A0A9W6YFP5_9STRA|nr:unnamed protein product [Phytophthora fragariaefolia]
MDTFRWATFSVATIHMHNINLPEFTAWPGDPSLLKTQDPAIGSGKHKKGRHAKARDTLQGNPGPDPDPEYWIHGPQDPNRKTTGSGHYTASSVRISTLLAKIPKSRQDIHSSTLELFNSYQRSRSSPTDGYTR